MQVAWCTVVGTRQSALATCLIALGTCLLASCSESAIEEPQTVDQSQAANSDSYYITLRVSNPTEAVTRSSSTKDENNGYSSSGVLPGTTDETALVSATLYFCIDDVVKASFPANYISTTNTDGESTIRIELGEDPSALSSIVGSSEQDVQLFLVGNTTYGSNKTLFSPTGVGIGDNLEAAKFSISGVEDMPIGNYGSSGHIMPLVNAKEFKVSIPGKTSGKTELDVVKSLFERRTATIAWWDVKDNDNNNVLKLERAVARLEYKDKRAETSNEILKEDHNFQVGDLNVYVKLYSLTPFNINKESYLFRHSAKAEGTGKTATGKAELFGNEIITGGYNWVANPDWNYTANVGYSFASTGRNFLNPLSLNDNKDAYIIDSTDPENDGTITISELNSRTNGSGDGYHPWCYVSENTVYSTELMPFKTATSETTSTTDLLAAKYATGVAFKVLVLNQEGKPLQYSENRDKYPIEITNSITTEAAKTGRYITITDKDEYWVDVAPETATIDGKEGSYYFLTYIACIVHNDDSEYAPDENKFAPMFYGVVRNNTYQMSVEGIDGLPLPREPKSMYLRLNVNVLPWNVRKNDFYF